jgi:hypothetical protein
MRNYGINYDAGLTADGDCTRKRSTTRWCFGALAAAYARARP